MNIERFRVKYALLGVDIQAILHSSQYGYKRESHCDKSSDEVLNSYESDNFCNADNLSTFIDQQETLSLEV